jgi:uncharacterized protein (UPF0332 family)
VTPAIERLLVAAQSKVQAAELLFKEGLYGDAASRAYYAVFHSISALHLSRDQTFSSHAQLIGRFNKDFIRSGVFPPEYTRIVTRLFEDRQQGDYDSTVEIGHDQASQDLIDARRIVVAIHAHLQASS